MHFSTNIDKKIIKTLSCKYRQKRFGYAKPSATDTLKSSSKKQFKKQLKQLAIRFIIKLNTQYSGSYDYKADSDTTTLISSNEEIQDVMKIVKFFKESRLLIKGVSETNEEESKEQKRWISKYVVRFNWC